jgi:hypothetical protein
MSLPPFSLGARWVSIIAKPPVSEASPSWAGIERRILTLLVILGAFGCRLTITGIATDPSGLRLRALPTVMEGAGCAAARSSFVSTTPFLISTSQTTIGLFLSFPLALGRTSIAHLHILTIVILRILLGMSNPLTAFFPSTRIKCLAYGYVFLLGCSFVCRSSAP